MGFPVKRYNMLENVTLSNNQLRDLAGNAFQGFCCLAMIVALFAGMPPEFLVPLQTVAEVQPQAVVQPSQSSKLPAAMSFEFHVLEL